MGQTLPQMGLATWNDQGDNYNFAQLANNWNIVNYHDHSPNKGVPIPQGGLAPNSVGIRELIIGSWVTLTHAGSVTNFTGGYPAQVQLQLDGTVRLKGKLINITGSPITAVSGVWATIPITPAGLRPTDSSGVGVVCVGAYSVSLSAPVPVAVMISNAGVITCNFAVPNNQWLSLDGITFTTS